MLALCALSAERGYAHYFYGATDQVLAARDDARRTRMALPVADGTQMTVAPLPDGQPAPPLSALALAPR